jgi:DNA-binding IclR family transcriptional regulator
MARPSPQTTRLVDLVEALAASPDHGLSLTELAHHLGVTPATCHPMVTELAERGWLRRHPVRRTYRLGPALVALGRAAAGAAETQELARAALVELQRAHRVDGLVLMPGDDELTVVDLVPDRRGTGIDVGDQVPFRAPLGASVAAFSDAAVVERWLTAEPPEALRASYLELVDAVRDRGYAVELTGTVDARIYEMLAQIGGRFADGSGDGGDPARGRLRSLLDEIVGELGGLGWFHPVELDPDATYQVGTMSAPVFGPAGDVVLVLAVRGLPERVTGSEVQRLGLDLVTAADEVTEASGGRRPGVRAAA